MNLQFIKEIIDNQHLSFDIKNKMILNVIAEDKKCIPYLMELLEIERKQNRELITDMNLELSRADVHIQEPLLMFTVSGPALKRVNDIQLGVTKSSEYVLNHITAFYVKYRHRIVHCFNKQV